jgi:hypothetical protein
MNVPDDSPAAEEPRPKSSMTEKAAESVLRRAHKKLRRGERLPIGLKQMVDRALTRRPLKDSSDEQPRPDPE